ncbi:DUF2917 domain-containing protein [Achromobacter mucicolens]|uniref:DUF2917 domain-containing protein n=1 Tax=Achromobacter mucicolens TaxID=1389922 RepID=UPI003C7A939E
MCLVATTSRPQKSLRRDLQPYRRGSVCVRLQHYALSKGQILRLRRCRNARVDCRSDIVSVTFTNDKKDYVMGAGDFLILPNMGLCLIEAESETCMLRISGSSILIGLLHKVRLAK